MAYVLTGSIIGSFGAVFLKSGALALRRHWSSFVFNWRLGVGVIAYMLSSVLFVKGISKGELSVLYPMVSLGYIATLLWSRVFFHEPVTKSKLGGVALILLGIVFLAFGNRDSNPPAGDHLRASTGCPAPCGGVASGGGTFLGRASNFVKIKSSLAF
jgi:drug/metabolite transporter (DMT)-like permease